MLYFASEFENGKNHWDWKTERKIIVYYFVSHKGIKLGVLKFMLWVFYQKYIYILCKLGLPTKSISKQRLDFEPNQRLLCKRFVLGELVRLYSWVPYKVTRIDGYKHYLILDDFTIPIWVY